MALFNCPECGKQISDKAQSCVSCGAPVTPQEQATMREASKDYGGMSQGAKRPSQPSKPKAKVGLRWALFLIVVGGLYLVWRNSEVEDSQQTRTVAVSSAPAIILPDDESAFVKAVTEARDQYRGSTNDLVKGGTRSARSTAVCQALGRKPTVDRWVGTIETLSSNSDGKGVLGIRLGDDVFVKTWNNAISDNMDHTLIDPNSTLFKSLAKLVTGQQVTFSGTFLGSDVDCVRESSMTLSGSMTKPEYLMRFRQVEANS